MAQQDIIIGTADAKAGDTLFSAFTKIQSNFTELYVDNTANNIVVINDESDFPTPVSGVITLTDNITYHIGAQIVTSNRFLSGAGTGITAGNPFGPALVYTGVGTMFTGTDVNFVLGEIAVSAPNGQFFDFKSTGVAGNTFGLNIVSLIECQTVGVFDNLRSINITNSSVFSAQQGFLLSGSGNWGTLSFTKMGLTSSNAAFVGIDLGDSVQRSVEFNDYVLNGVAGSVGIKGLPNNANITADFVASVNRCEFIPPTTPISGITQNDIRYSFLGNAGIMDSTVDANPYLSVETTVAINTSGVYEKINQGNWLSTTASRMSVSTDGDVTNLLETDIKLQMTGTVTLEKVGGGADLLTARLVYNDDPLDSQSIITEVGTDNTNPTNLCLTGIFTLAPGDSISIYVANQDGTSNVVVNYAKFTLLRVL